MNESGSSPVEDVYAVTARKGDKVFIPAYYGHVTINQGPDELKMSNWVANNFQSDYSLILEKQGACYFAVSQESKIKWIKNANYGKVPEIRFEEPNKNIPSNLKKALVGE
jgi:oxalate decarboxylase/phosphoglucose isomerase-like protein (cupin superfamily)